MKKYHGTGNVISLSFIIFVIVLMVAMFFWILTSAVNAQEIPTFYDGDTVIIEWDTPTDDDIAHYTAVFSNSVTSEKDTLTFESWSTSAADRVQSPAHDLTIGTGLIVLTMTATDYAGNVSEPSNNFVFNVQLKDTTPPGAPAHVLVRLLVTE